MGTLVASAVILLCIIFSACKYNTKRKVTTVRDDEQCEISNSAYDPAMNYNSDNNSELPGK